MKNIKHQVWRESTMSIHRTEGVNGRYIACTRAAGDKICFKSRDGDDFRTGEVVEVVMNIVTCKSVVNTGARGDVANDASLMDKIDGQ